MSKKTSSSAAADVRVFGIRHHGPGSARNLVAALAEFRPDCILIEGPPDADHLIRHVADAGMEPPVALLVYNPKKLSQASFYPFAEFSPEWQAMRFGLANGLAVRFMDLPVGQMLLLRDDAENQQVVLDFVENESPEEALLRLDPFTRLARLAGYSDAERWWESVFERWTVAAVDGGQIAVDGMGNTLPLQGAGGAIFEEIQAMFAALRADKAAAGHPESAETLLREAHMRHTIRVAENEGFGKIALVCGAWHAPALADFRSVKSSADAALLKGLKKVKTEATWVAWSFDRLAQASGYGAGVLAPAWYRLLFSSPQSAVTQWFTGAARVLREQGLPVSSAHIIEAVRLADTLARLRRTALPGIEELREAATAVLCEGSEKPLELLERQMVIGEAMGVVPASVPVVPLKEDFEKEAKSCRLVISPVEAALALDLREAAHLRKSQLLHRLDLLGIKWGREQAVSGPKQGRFHESWMLRWQPEMEIQLIEAGTWGLTVPEAATNFARQKLTEIADLPTLSGLLGAVLKADLPGILPDLLSKLQSTAAVAKDVLALADTVPPLADILRYGSARTLNLAAIEQLLAQIIPRVCVGLPVASMGVDEEVAAQILQKIVAFNRALALRRNEEFDGLWSQTLGSLAVAPGIAPLVAGLGARFLFDKNTWPPARTEAAMRLRLSLAAAPYEGAAWLEGFLGTSGLLLIHHPELWQVLDGWLCGLEAEIFRETLPLLRRTFAHFPAHEREKMLDLAKNTGVLPQKNSPVEGFAAEAAEAVLPFLRLVLGQPAG